jgi:hypothetical protein
MENGNLIIGKSESYNNDRASVRLAKNGKIKFSKQIRI